MVKVCYNPKRKPAMDRQGSEEKDEYPGTKEAVKIFKRVKGKGAEQL